MNQPSAPILAFVSARVEYAVLYHSVPLVYYVKVKQNSYDAQLYSNVKAKFLVLSSDVAGDFSRSPQILTHKVSIY